MKNSMLPAIKLTLLTLVFFSIIYTVVLWGIAQAAPGGGKGEVIYQDGKKYYANIGQSFTDDKYFNSRPSAVGYNASGSGASNKGPTNAEYLQLVKDRIDTFLVHNPDINKSDIPVELVTASGSGLDPHISTAAALVQVKRIARVRNLNDTDLKSLIEQNTESSYKNLSGTINVLKLNLALDKFKK